MDNQIAAKYQQHSVLGLMGKTIEPAVRPLGWDWRIGCAVIASFPAREVVVATLGVVYGLGKKVDTKSEEDRGALGARLNKPFGTARIGRCSPCPWRFADGVFRALRAMRGDAGRDPAGDEQLAMAGVCLHLHDGLGLCRRVDYLSGRNMVGVIGSASRR